MGVLLLVSGVAGIRLDAARARSGGSRFRIRTYVISAVGLALAIACFVIGLTG